MRHFVVAAVAAASAIGLLSGCSNADQNAGPLPGSDLAEATFTENVLSTESLDIKVLDVDLTQRSVARIDFKVRNKSGWESTLHDAWLTHVGVRQYTPSKGTQTLKPVGHTPDAATKADESAVIAPGKSARGSISYRVVDAKSELVISTFDDNYVYVGESTFVLR